MNAIAELSMVHPWSSDPEEDCFDIQPVKISEPGLFCLTIANHIKFTGNDWAKLKTIRLFVEGEKPLYYFRELDYMQFEAIDHLLQSAH